MLLLEAGQDTPHGKIPPEVLDSYPGTAYFDPRFHWTQLKVRTETVSHNNPGEGVPPLRNTSRRAFWAAGLPSTVNSLTVRWRRYQQLPTHVFPPYRYCERSGMRAQ